MTGLILGIGGSTPAQESQVPWVVNTSERLVKLLPVVDRVGNTLVVGHYRDSATLGNLTLPAPTNGYINTCLAKVDANGRPLWIRPLQLSNIEGDVVVDDAVLTPEEEIVCVGRIDGSVMWGGTELRTGALVMRIRQDGGIVWAKSFGGEGSARKVALDTNGFIYAAGFYYGAFTLDDIALPAAAQGVFLTKLTENGLMVWARGAGQPEGGVNVQALAVSAEGSVYIGGWGSDGIPFAPLTLSSEGDADGYVVRYDSEGTPSWLFSFGSARVDKCYAIGIKAQGRIFALGKAGSGDSGLESVRVGEWVLPTSISSDFGFVIVLNANGGADAVVPFNEVPVTGAAALMIDGDYNAVVFGKADGGMRIGDRSLADPGIITMFAANIGADGRCNWLVPIPNLASANYVHVAQGSDGSFRLTGGRLLMRVDLPNLRPSLKAIYAGPQLKLTWSAVASGFTLQSASALLNGGDWQNVDTPPTKEGNQQVITVDRQNDGSKFFRLWKP